MSTVRLLCSREDGIVVGTGATVYTCASNGKGYPQTAEADAKLTYRTAGTLSNLVARLTAGNRTADHIVVLRNGGTDGGGLDITYTTTPGEFEDATGSNAVAAGDTVSIRLKSGTGGTTDFSFPHVGVTWSATGDTTNHLAGVNPASNLTVASTTYYSTFDCSFTTTQAEGEWLVKLPTGVDHVTIKNLYVRLSANTSTNAISFTVNGATGTGTAPTLSIAGSSGAIISEDTANSIQVKDGDKISIKIVTGASTVAATITAMGFEVQSDDGVFHMVNSSTTALSLSSTNSSSVSGGLQNIVTEANLQAKIGGAYVVNALAVYVKAGNTGTINMRVGAANSGPSVSTAAANAWATDTTHPVTLSSANEVNTKFTRTATPTVTCIALTLSASPGVHARGIAESAGATATVARALVEARSLAEVAGATETIARGITEARSISEVAGATESIARTLVDARSLAEAAGATATIAASQSPQTRSLAEVAGATDAVARALAESRSLAEVAGATEAIARAVVEGRSLAETAGATATVARSLVEARSISEVAGATATVARALGVARSIAEVAGATATVARALVLSRAITAVAGATGSISAVVKIRTVIGPTVTQLLDLDVAVRQESVRFDLLDQNLNFLGSLAVDRINLIPEIVNDVNRPIRRTVGNFRLLPRNLADADSPLFFAGEVNVFTARVQPVWVLGDGGADYEFPLGVFLWGSDQSRRSTQGIPEDCTLVDQCSILYQALSSSVSFPTGTSVATALAAQAAFSGIVSVSIEASSATLSAPVAWFAGSDTNLAVMESLCASGGYYAPYFDNNGVLQCRLAPDISTSSPDVTYLMGSRIVRDSILESDDLLNAPNRYIVIDNSATASPLVGIFDVPASAPHSFENRGFRVVQSTNVQGLADQATADTAAAAQYAQGSATFSWLSFESAPDPRHDTFSIVGVQLTVGGAVVNYREQGWRLPCAPGSKMHHDCRKVYTS